MERGTNRQESAQRKRKRSVAKPGGSAAFLKLWDLYLALCRPETRWKGCTPYLHKIVKVLTPSLSRCAIVPDLEDEAEAGRQQCAWGGEP